MLHRADAHWVPGRSDALRKLKPLADEEARVLAHLPVCRALPVSCGCDSRSSAVEEGAASGKNAGGVLHPH